MTTIFWLSSIAIILPWLYFFPPHIQPNPYLSLFLLLHTLFILYNILAKPPPNLFSDLGIPLGTPTEKLRKIIKTLIPDEVRSKDLDNLLTRMGSFEFRTLYVRFGHKVVSSCDYCQSYTDFALYSLPAFLWSYIREAVLIGLVTMKGSNNEKYRTLCVGALACAGAIEAYWLSTVAITVPKDKDSNAPPRAWYLRGNVGAVMWHDDLYLLRHVFFLLLPLAIQIYSLRTSAAARGVKTQIRLTPTANRHLTTLKSLFIKVQLLKYTRGSIHRVPELSSSSNKYWTQEKREGEWVRESEAVRTVARRTGLGFDGVGEEGEVLRKNAHEAVKALQTGFIPSEHWRKGPER